MEVTIRQSREPILKRLLISTARWRQWTTTKVVIIMFWFYLVSYFKINDLKSKELVQSPIDKSDTHFKMLFLKKKTPILKFKYNINVGGFITEV